MGSRWQIRHSLCFCVTTGLLVVARSAPAQSVQDACPYLFQNLYQSAECVEAAFTQTDIPHGLPHLTLSSIAPGNGFPIGIVWDKRKHFVESPFDNGAEPNGQAVAGNKSLVDFDVALVRSTNGSWFGTASVVWLPPIPQRKTRQKVGVRFYVTHRKYRHIGFFGLGPASPSDQTTYRQTDTLAGASLRVPLGDWVSMTAGVENRKPDVAFSVSSFGATAITEITAPGIASQPDFMHYSAGITLRTQAINEPVTDDPAVTQPGGPEPPLMKHKIVLTLDSDATEHWYEDQDQGMYSFRQLVIGGDDAIKFHAVIRRFVPPKAMTTGLRILKHFCNDRPSGLKVDDECDFGELRVRPLLVLSNAGSGTVPFYLQPTLGGSDIDSTPSLLGYDNYRFRAPDAAMVGLDYEMQIINPVGGSVFYDAGTVGSAMGGFAGARLRQDVGVGTTLQIGGNVVARGYVAFGGVAGAHFGYNFTKFF